MENDGALPRDDPWRPWPVSWSGVWAGTLTALAVLVIVGLTAIAVGAHLIGPSSRILSWHELGLMALIFSVCGGFFSFVAGGWVAARVAGLRRAEPAMLHGALAWLVAVPLLLVLTGVGAGSIFGSWYSGLAGTPSWVQAPVPKVAANTDDEAVKKEADDAARATRNAALGALTALLLGLMGSVVGGWMGSGEPMHFSHYFDSDAPTREKQEAVTV
jgi:hypothetical protein